MLLALYRKFVLHRLMQELGVVRSASSVASAAHVEQASQIVQREFDICAAVGERYSKNYHCWSYRREALKWLLTKETVSIDGGAVMRCWLIDGWLVLDA
jgi:hypothetical protein